MSNDNPNGTKQVEAVNLLLSAPIGKMLIGILVWSLTAAYAVGAMKFQVNALSTRLDQIERKVDAVDDILRQAYPKIANHTP